MRLKLARPSLKHMRWPDAAVALLMVALLLWVSPLQNWWASGNKPWYSIYLVWGFIIALAYLLQRRFRRDEL